MGEANLARVLQVLQEQRSALAEQFHVRSLSVFGSYVRQEQRPDSDLDLLVTFSETPGLLKFIALENHLADLLGVPVDLVMPEALKPHIGRNVRREMVPVYDR